METPISQGIIPVPQSNQFPVVPLGEFPISQDGVNLIYVLDGVALDRIRASFNNMASKPGFAGLLVDFDGFSDDVDKETRAAGWCMDLVPGENGLDGIVRLTTSGRNAIEGGDYRFFEPKFDEEGMESLGGDRYRPISLTHLSLTNRPRIANFPTITNRSSNAQNIPPAQRMAETSAAIIANRAREIMVSEPKRGVLSAYVTAQLEVAAELQGKPGDRSNFIANRARKIRAKKPEISVLQSYIEAQR